MKHFFLVLLGLFTLLPAQAAQIFPGPTIFQSTIKPNATGQDMNDASSRWDIWVGQLNTPYGAGFAYIDSSGYLQRLAYGTSAQYYRADGTLQTLDTSVVPENGNLYFTDERAQDAVGGMAANSSKVSLTYTDATPSLVADIIAGSLVNADINASAAIAYSKLNLAGSIVNADVSNSAAIAYSKLNLSGSIVNADVNASAAIAYSKLALTGSIVNADVSASAAIAYSKLALTGSIVNADVSASAAIAYSKLNLASSIVSADIVDGTIVDADVNASAAIAYSKLNLAASVANSDLATMAQATVKGRASGAGTGAPADLSASQVNTIVGSDDLTLTKAAAIQQTTDSSTGNIDALTTTNISAIRLTGAAPVLRGIGGGANGKLLIIVNAAGADISVKNQDSNPTAANRIITGTGSDLTLADTASILLSYDSTTSRWRIVGWSSGGASPARNVSVHHISDWSAASGWGSTDTAVVKMSGSAVVQQNTGTGITYANTSTAGATWTIAAGHSGICSMNGTVQGANNYNEGAGITKNADSTTRTTNIDGYGTSTAAYVLAYNTVTGSTARGTAAHVSWRGPCTAGDVFRLQGINGVTRDSALVYFTLEE